MVAPLQQLPLGIGLRDSATFENYVPGANAEALFCVTGEQEGFVFLWGAKGSGRTHLLQAACHAAGEQGRGAVYLPCDEVREMAPAVFEDLERLALVCLDDIQHLLQEPAWEQAVFHLYNRIRDAGGRLLVTADQPPQALPVGLADLRSRLGWGPVFHLKPLDDEAKLDALRGRAQARGFELPDEVGRFLLRRLPRDMHALFDALTQLERESLAAQRKLTIPFVKAVLRL